MVSSEDTGSPVLLIGTGEPDITFLRGGQWGVERTRGIFYGAKWAFYPDGTFLFTPPLVADVRDDLYPINGTYTQTSNQIEFQGEKVGSLGASASLDGVIYKRGEDFLMETIDTVTSTSQKIAKIAQTLSQQSQPASLVSKVMIHDIQVPDIFKIALVGTVDTQHFGPLAATFKILPPYEGDSNPFLIQFSTDQDRGVGRVFWASFTSRQTGQGVLNSDIALIGKGQIRLQCEGNKNPISPSWSTLTQGDLIGGIVCGATATRGMLTVSFQGDHISGSVHASGFSDMKQPSTYKADFTGQRQEL